MRQQNSVSRLPTQPKKLSNKLLAETRVRLGTGPQGPSQVQRNGRWSAQRQKGVLFRSCGVVSAHAPSLCGGKEESCRHERSRCRSDPLVAEEVSPVDLFEGCVEEVVFRLYPLWFALFTILLPVSIPVYFWNETVWNSFWINFNMRFCITLNIAFFVNSVAHMWGQKPYDK